ncbi:MAG: dockerin type I repeat-containing protein [Ruminococcus sp.]|nr:dockerin type I repeat-containing protein [Ruminococcus sp.]
MRDTALLYFYELRDYLINNPDDTQYAELFAKSLVNYDLNELPEEIREFLENRESIRNKELFAKSKYYWPSAIATLDSKLLARYHLTHTLKPEYFTEEYYSDVVVFDALTNYDQMFRFDYFFYFIGGTRTSLLNQMRGAFPGDLEPLFDLNGDGVFDLHDVQDYTEYQFGYKVPEAEYAAIVDSDAVDITKYREYPDSDDSISEAVFKNCVKLEMANIEFEKTYGFAYQEKENPESIVRIGFQNMIELYFMNNEYKLIYAKPEYYTENRPGCEGLPLYDRVDLYSFVSQYAGSHGFTTTKLSFNETTFNLFYDKWSAAVKNGTADLPDVNGNGIIDKDDFSFLQQYEKEIWAKTPETDTKLPRSIRSFLDTEFDLNENGISGDLYDVMGASVFIRANYPELTPDVSTSAVPETTISFPKGDANCDGKVSVADSVAILQFIANRDKFDLKPQGKENADVNGDGSVTGSDALEIQKMDAGIIVIK